MHDILNDIIRVGDYIEFTRESPFVSPLYHPHYFYQPGDWARVRIIRDDGHIGVKSHTFTRRYTIRYANPNDVRKRSKPVVLRPSTYLTPILALGLAALGYLQGGTLMHSTLVRELLQDPVIYKALTGLIAVVSATGGSALVVMLIRSILRSITGGVSAMRLGAEQRSERARQLAMYKEDRQRAIAREEAARKQQELLELVHSIVPTTNSPASTQGNTQGNTSRNPLAIRPGAIVRFKKNEHSTTINGKPVTAGDCGIVDTISGTNNIVLKDGNMAYYGDFEVIGYMA